ncbi:unnamed protein product [Prunus brigantina]
MRIDGCLTFLTTLLRLIDRPSKELLFGLDSFTFSGSRKVRFLTIKKSLDFFPCEALHHELTTENSSLQRMLHESQQEVEKLKEENNALLKLVSSYSVDTLRRLDMLQVSNEKILEDHERLMSKLKRRRHIPSKLPNIIDFTSLHLRCRMESIPSDSVQFFEDMKVAMDKDLGKQVFAYFLNAFTNSAQYILGPFFSACLEEVAKVWVTQPRSGPTYFSNFTWAPVWESAKPFKGWPTGTPLKPDPTATKEAPSKKASSAAGKPDHSSSADGKFDWYHWFKALEPKLRGHWKKIGIYDTLLLCAGSPFPCDRSLIIAALCFWSSSTNCMRLRFGMMTPNLLDLAAIAGLHPHGDDFSAANLPEGKVGLDFHKSNKTSGSWVKTYLGHGGDPTDPPSLNGISHTEHVAFLVMWLCKFLACPKSGGITKEFQALVEVLADGHQVAMGPIFLTYLYRGLREVITKPMDYHASGLIKIFQLWLQLYFPELSPTTVCPNDKALLGPPLLNAPSQKHYVEDWF